MTLQKIRKRASARVARTNYKRVSMGRLPSTVDG